MFDSHTVIIYICIIAIAIFTVSLMVKVHKLERIVNTESQHFGSHIEKALTAWLLVNDQWTSACVQTENEKIAENEGCSKQKSPKDGENLKNMSSQ